MIETDVDTVILLILLFLDSSFMAWLISWAIFGGLLRTAKAREELESLSSGGQDE
ncbi:MAG: hypothetical protein IJJ66_01275 [Treponema sp.]|nr:hypothetical protein [Treponema sp.]MBR0125013.1 hypothetical protein [Treponema sp.]MBR0475431.1 hypothetical protein [Treponema sp.]